MSARLPAVWLKYDKCDLCGERRECLGFGYLLEHSKVEDVVVKLCWRCLCFVRGKMKAIVSDVGPGFCAPLGLFRGERLARQS